MQGSRRVRIMSKLDNVLEKIAQEQKDYSTRGVKIGSHWYLSVKQAAARIPRADGVGFVSVRRVRQFIGEKRIEAIRSPRGYMLRLTDVTAFASKARSSGIAIKTNGSSE